MATETEATRLAVLEQEVQFLKARSVERDELTKLLEPIRQEQAVQSESMKQMAKDVSKTADMLHGVLKTYQEDILARAQAWSLGNVIRTGAVVFGSVTGIIALGTLVYAAIRFVSHLP